jgi:putative ABC transport system permease protein
MLKNYILISFRNLRKHLSYSIINVVGLGLGLATCILLITWIRHEVSFDRFHEKSDRIYRASLEYSFGGQVAATSVSPTALLPAVLTLPEVETGVRIFKTSASNPKIIRNGDKLFQETKFYIADSTFFDVFSFKLLQGNPKVALTQPYSLVLTKTASRNYFGEEDAMGKVVNVDGTQDYTVTGIMEDVPENSMIKFNVLASFNSISAGRDQPHWWSANYQTFFVLHPNANVNAVQEKTNEIVMKAVASGPSSPGDYVRYNFMPLTDIYLRSPYVGEPEILSDILYIYIFSGIALLILIIACINYINLATAKAADRAREVGIRKVVGAMRRQLFTQFIGESVIITLFSYLVAIFLAETLLPLFNSLTGKNFGFSIFVEPGFLFVSIITLILIAVFAGAYPAFAITSFKPVTVLKGSFKTSGRGIWLRKSLVVFQFGISVVLIMGTLVIVKQLDFVQSKNLGYDRENTIILPLDQKTREVYERFKTEVLRNGLAVDMGRGSESPVQIGGGYTVKPQETDDPGIVTGGLTVDEGYLPTTGIEIEVGRHFTQADFQRAQRDTIYTFIVNHTALDALFIQPEEALGKKLKMGGREGEIIGIIKDFHFASLHTNIAPLVIFPEDQFQKIFIKLPAGNVKENLDRLASLYKSVITHRPFEYQFLDEQYEALYVNEQRMSFVFIVFATLAIIIACLGLLGLVSFSAAQKTKEIGIRKVMGATPQNIVLLITKDFTKLVCISIFIGLPLAYFVMDKWLENFAYKTPIGIQPFVASAIICILIALGTAGYQAVRAALLDPAETLRNE